MQVSITVDTSADAELSAKDIRILRAVMGDAGDLKEAAETAEEKPAATRTRRTAKKAAAAPEPDPEPDTSGDEDGPQLDDAVALATELVADGKTAEVKKVLATLKVKRVSELEGDNITKFLDAFGSDDDSPI